MQKPTVLIIGGVDKGNDYSLIAELVKEKEYQKPKQYQTKQPAKARIVIEN